MLRVMTVFGLLAVLGTSVAVQVAEEEEEKREAAAERHALSEYGDLPSAVGAIGATEAVLVVDRPETLRADLTVPSNVSLVFIRGALIATNGHALTVNGALQPPGPVRIFDTSAGGGVTFAAGAIRAARPEWWENGDVSKALRAYPHVELLERTYTASAGLVGQGNGSLIGQGILKSVIRYTGDGSEDFLRPGGTAWRMDGFQLDGRNAAGLNGIVCDSNRPYRADWGAIWVRSCPGTGVLFAPADGGIAYSDLGDIKIDDCGVGLDIHPTEAGWVNANTGRFRIHSCTTIGARLWNQGRGADGNFLYIGSEKNDVGLDVMAGRGNHIDGWLEANASWELKIADAPRVLDFHWRGPIEDMEKVSYTHSRERTVVIDDNQFTFVGGRASGGLDGSNANKWAILQRFQLRNARIAGFGLGHVAITSGATPSVDEATLVELEYDAPAEITDFTGAADARSFLVLYARNANAFINDGGNFNLSADWTPGAGDTLTLARVYNGAAFQWIELGRSNN